MKNSTTIVKKFDSTKLNKDWSFQEKRSANYLTHGYHRYPAKFIPELVSKLVENYAIHGERIADPFAGCGTTLVESRMHGYDSIGIDVNPVAIMITQAKIQHIDPKQLRKVINGFHSDIDKYDKNSSIDNAIPHERIDYWFRKEEKKKISFLYSLILKINNQKHQTFLLCALSNILKNSSKWLQTSTKPQVDPNKKPTDPLVAIKSQLKKMEMQNEKFFFSLKENNSLSTTAQIKLADARKTKIKSDSIGTIITSPPYVTSYEYADIHQLTGYWFDYFQDLKSFRKNFIGTFYSGGNSLETNTDIGQNIVDQLAIKNLRAAREVASYFNDMFISVEEMKRILKKSGRLCLVVGNTTMMDVHIKSAETIAEMLTLIDFDIKDVIRREIPVKIIPTIRDKKTGRFTNLSNKNSKKVYPEEYIIIAQKK